MGFERGRFWGFFWLLFCWREGDSFDLLVWGNGGIVDILRDGWDSWGEWERRVREWESGEGGKGGVEGRGGEEEEEEERKRMERDGDGMVYVYMIVQMSTNIRASQTRKSESFLWGKKSSCEKKKTGSVTRLLLAHFVNIRHRNKQVLGTGTLDSAAAFLIISFSHRCWPHLTTQDRILFKSARDV